jgi:hypothetical protein
MLDGLAALAVLLEERVPLDLPHPPSTPNMTAPRANSATVNHRLPPVTPHIMLRGGEAKIKRR